MKTRKIWMVALMVIVALSFVYQSEAQGNRSIGIGRGKPEWSTTSWQKSLPDIVVKEDSREKTYSFRSLIDADGYLCPGSARCYQTLKTALPLLYKDAVPEKGDLLILYGPSSCAEKVYRYFMGRKYRSDTHLRSDKSLAGRQQAIIRKSTGEKILITYDPPEADGHTPQGARAGDAVLKATNGAGMKIKTVTP